MNDFINESNELLDRAETDVLTLESEGFSDDLVNGIFRAIHTIKGNAGLFELNSISALAHSLESMLNLVRNRELQVSMEIIDLSLASVDRLREMIKNVSESDSFDVSDLVTSLDRVRGAGEKKSEPAPASQPVVAAASAPVQDPVAPAPAAKEEAPRPGASASASETKSSGDTGGKLKIPARFLEEAKKENCFLTFASIDLGESDAGSVAFRDEIDRLKSGSGLVYTGIRTDRIRPLSDSSEPTLPAFFLFKTSNPLDGGMTIAGLNLSGIKEIYKPVIEEEESIEISDTSDEPLSPVEAVVPGDTAVVESVPVEIDPVPVPVEPVPESQPAQEIAHEEPAHEEATPADSGAKKASSRESRETAETHLRVPTRLIDSLINLAGETVIARNELMQRITENRDAALESVGKRMSFLITRLQEGIMRTRLQELNIVFQKVPRIVRDAAQGTGKLVDLSLEGGEVELDKTLIDAIGDSIMHIIRNSVDHGLEPPEERVKAGKAQEGHIRVAAVLRGGNVVLSIKDDGRGLNLEKIKQKAIASGVVSKEATAHMSDEEIAELVFEPGLSTAEKVSRTSGRGVGMDVVRSNLKKVGGSVEIVSEPGKGTVITATLPQTLSIVTCLMIRSRNQLYALPQQNVLELILLDRKQLREVEGHEVYDLRGHLLPILNLARTMNLKNYDKSDPTHIVVVRSERHHFGLLIDEVVNLEEIVVKRLGEHFAGLSFFSGAAILGDGESVLILDVPGLAKFANLQANLQDKTDDELRSKSEQKQVSSGNLLFSVYDQQFAVTVETVPRIEKIEAKDIDIFMGIEVIRYRGEVVPIVRLEEVYDLQVDKRDLRDYYVIIFNTDGMRTGIVSTEIHNVVDAIPEIDDHTFAGQSILGHTILGDDVTLILNAMELLTRLQSTRFKEIARHMIRKKGDSGNGPVSPSDPGSAVERKTLETTSFTAGLQELKEEVAARARQDDNGRKEADPSQDPAGVATGGN